MDPGGVSKAQTQSLPIGIHGKEEAAQRFILRMKLQGMDDLFWPEDRAQDPKLLGNTWSEANHVTTNITVCWKRNKKIKEGSV